MRVHSLFRPLPWPPPQPRRAGRQAPSEAFPHALGGAGVRRDLWPYLLGLAALLLPFDVGVRRLALGRRDLERAWIWMMERLPRRRPRPVVEVEAPSPVGRLFQAKSRAEERRPVGQVSVPAEPEVSPPPAGQPPAPAPPSRPAVSPAEPPAAPPPTTPSPVSRGRAGEGAAEGETLAGRLLKRKRGREEK